MFKSVTKRTGTPILFTILFWMTISADGLLLERKTNLPSENDEEHNKTFIGWMSDFSPFWKFQRVGTYFNKFFKNFLWLYSFRCFLNKLVDDKYLRMEIYERRHNYLFAKHNFVCLRVRPDKDGDSIRFASRMGQQLHTRMHA
ncbi:hypothetical protein ACJX0J_011456 [Zea mays]